MRDALQAHGVETLVTQRSTWWALSSLTVARCVRPKEGRPWAVGTYPTPRGS